MATAIRLRREGTRNSPYYKVVVADKRSPRDGKFLEILGICQLRARLVQFTGFFGDLVDHLIG